MTVQQNKIGVLTPYKITGVKESVPKSVVLTGTMATSGVNVFGSGTNFLSVLQDGDWLYIAADNAVRQIQQVFSDTRLKLVN